MKFDNGRLCVGPARLSWELGFGSGKKEEEIKYIGPQDMDSFTPAPNGGTWKKGALSVTVEYAEIDGILQGVISFSGNDGENTPIEEIIFPRAEMPLEEESCILLPVSQGRVMKNLTGEWDEATLSHTEGRYRSFRCTSVYARGKGIYFDCRDSRFYNKGYKWRKEAENLVYRHIHYLPLDGKGEFTLPYRCGVTEFEGGWFETAMIYKKWARQQIWYKNALREKNPLKDVSMWLWNRGRIDYVFPPPSVWQRIQKCPSPLTGTGGTTTPTTPTTPTSGPPGKVSKPSKTLCSA